MTGWRYSMSGAGYGLRLGLALAAECAYLAVRTVAFERFSDIVEREIAVSTARLASALFLLWLFPELLRRAPGHRATPRHPLLLTVIAADFFVMPLAGLVDGYQGTTSIVLAVTAPIVGVREEVFYRGILQGALERAFVPVLAVAGSALLFTLSHIGTQPFNLLTISLFFSAGVLYGVIYHRTRNLALVIGLHAAYDIAVVLVPQVRVIAPGAALLANLVVIWVVVLWARMDTDKMDADNKRAP